MTKFRAGLLLWSVVAVTYLLPPVCLAQNAANTIKLLTEETTFGKRYEVAAVLDNGLTFSRDGKRLAYWSWQMDPAGTGYYLPKVYVVVNGVRGKLYDCVDYENPRAATFPPGDFIFSPDSRHLAYRALQGENWMVVRDGKAGRPYYEKRIDHYDGRGSDVIDDIIFSPDSQHLAYRA